MNLDLYLEQVLDAENDSGVFARVVKFFEGLYKRVSGGISNTASVVKEKASELAKNLKPKVNELERTAGILVRQLEKVEKEADKLDNVFKRILAKIGIFLLKASIAIEIGLNGFFSKLDEILQKAQQKKDNLTQFELLLQETIADADRPVKTVGLGIAKVYAAVTLAFPPLGLVLSILGFLAIAVFNTVAWALFKAAGFEAGAKLAGFKRTWELLKTIFSYLGPAFKAIIPALKQVGERLKGIFSKGSQQNSSQIIHDVLGMLKRAWAFIISVVKKVLTANALLRIGFVALILGLLVYAIATRNKDVVTVAEQEIRKDSNLITKGLGWVMQKIGLVKTQEA